MSSNSPYESTVILQNDALNKMLANMQIGFEYSLFEQEQEERKRKYAKE